MIVIKCYNLVLETYTQSYISFNLPFFEVVSLRDQLSEVFFSVKIDYLLEFATLNTDEKNVFGDNKRSKSSLRYYELFRRVLSHIYLIITLIMVYNQVIQ